MPKKKKLDFDVKRYPVAEVLYPDHVVPLHVGEWYLICSIFSSLVGSLCHTAGIVRRVLSVSTITTRNN